jgi:hypothetical protein
MTHKPSPHVHHSHHHHPSHKNTPLYVPAAKPPSHGKIQHTASHNHATSHKHVASHHYAPVTPTLKHRTINPHTSTSASVPGSFKAGVGVLSILASYNPWTRVIRDGALIGGMIGRITDRRFHISDRVSDIAYRAPMSKSALDRADRWLPRWIRNRWK